MRSVCFACCLGLYCCQNILIAKTSFWFSVASAAEEEHINRVNSCLSTTRVSIVVCTVSSLFAITNALLLIPARAALSQAFCFQVIGSNISILTFEAFMVTLGF